MIKCPIHGVFEQNVKNHLRGYGCKKCVIDKLRKNSDQFIIDAIKIHKTTYDYSMVKYINSDTKVKIICPTHGIFEQTPRNHLHGNGCKKCICITDGKQFIDEAKLKHNNKYEHNNKYDYSLINYTNSRTKIKIICPIHGVFEQTPNNHISGYGCSLCGGTKTYSTADFIKKSTEIHGNKYDYSLSEYKKNNLKIKIICPVHGVFLSTPNNHLSNKGCPKCKQSKGEKIINEYLQKLNINFIKQKSFSECKNINPLPFDFYLPEHNVCIEYDGKQHFMPVDYFGGDDGFKQRKKHDQIKNIYCKQNNIILLRIKYNENIIEKLNENIKIQ